MLSKLSRPGRRRGVRSVAAAAAVVLLACAGVACGSGGAPTPPTVDITMVDYGYQYPNQGIPAGRVVFRVHNAGHSSHELVLLPLPADFPPLDKQLHSAQRRAVETLAVLPAVSPGGDGTFAVDLARGRYGIASFVSASDGQPDALHGMNSEFRVA